MFGFTHGTGCQQFNDRNGGLGIDMPGIDRFLQLARGQFGKVFGERVVETAFRQTPIQRHLTAFEAQQRNATTGFLALLALP